MSDIFHQQMNNVYNELRKKKKEGKKWHLNHGEMTMMGIGNYFFLTSLASMSFCSLEAIAANALNGSIKAPLLFGLE